MRLLGMGTQNAAATDPVCGAELDERHSAIGEHEHDGRTFYFCSVHCMSSFHQQPQTYAH